MELDYIVGLVNGKKDELGKIVGESPVFKARRENVASVGDVVLISYREGYSGYDGPEPKALAYMDRDRVDFRILNPMDARAFIELARIEVLIASSYKKAA